MHLTIVSTIESDLVSVLRANHVPFDLSPDIRKAVHSASEGSGVLVLADGYPDTRIDLPEDVITEARARNLRMYVEYPAKLPGLSVGEPQQTKWERAVVSSNAFAPDLEENRILMIHGCRFVPVEAESPHIVTARVAGFDTAVYGLPDETHPILFEHDGVLVSTTSLSRFVTARYAPTEAWPTIWRWILRWLGTDVGELSWTPSVHPAYSADTTLPDSAQRDAAIRGAEWYRKARLFIHHSWRDEAGKRLNALRPGPTPDERYGNGSYGMIEGASSSIHADGSQDWLNSVRNDCNGETAMAMALSHLLTGEGTGRGTAYALCDYVCFTSPISTGPRANPDSPTYGLMQWTTADALGGIYYGDDNARSLLGIMAAAAAMDSPRWDRHLLKCLLANLRTSGPTGFRARRLNDDEIQEKGWQHFFELNEPIYHPHYESYLWACFLWAYEHTGFTPFLERARTAISMTMHAYPEQWSWTNGIQQERARMVLPLAWLVRADDTPEHREWLKQITSELLAHQDSCGAIREEIGSAGLGHYGPPKTNEDYGTSEAPLIQANGDPLCDLLYTTNFAFIGLHEAAMATGDESLIAASDRLAEFLVRVQVESNAHPELDGAWFRAFEYKRWDYWASNADLGWGAWSIESGWTQGWITAVLAMREMNTSLWDLTANTRIGDHADQLTKMMLPGE